jgi:hypothetical protein
MGKYIKKGNHCPNVIILTPEENHVYSPAVVVVPIFSLLLINFSVHDTNNSTGLFFQRG